MYPKGCTLAFDSLMKEMPHEHYDSGCDGLCPECRTCRFHRPYWIHLVSDMRTNDVRMIGELGKYVPTFAAFEKGRLSLYREAAKEAEEIMQRWDDDFEPDEYFAD